MRLFCFLDGDIVMKSEELYNFIKGIRQGHEIVLNNLTWSVYLKMRPHYTTVGKYMLNRYLNKKEFVVGSLIAIPHAISRKVIEKTGVVEFSRSSIISSDGDV